VRVLASTTVFPPRGCRERTPNTGPSSPRHILCRKSDIHILDGIGCALQEGLMQCAHVLKRCFPAPIATSVGADVVPVFRRIVGWPDETIIERLIKCLDGSANACLSVVARRRTRQEEQTKDY